MIARILFSSGLFVFNVVANRDLFQSLMQPSGFNLKCHYSILPYICHLLRYHFNKTGYPELDATVWGPLAEKA